MTDASPLLEGMTLEMGTDVGVLVMGVGDRLGASVEGEAVEGGGVWLGTNGGVANANVGVWVGGRSTAAADGIKRV
jgi:hypothetical protein